MSLLLDALKKAALEKQRQAQEQEASGVVAADVTAKPPKKTHQGPTLLPSWEKKKNTTLVLDEGFDAPVKSAPMDAALSFAEPDAAPLASAAPLIGMETPAESVPVQAEGGLLDGSDQDLQDDATQAAPSCEFIDISDLDFAALVGFEETGSATVPVAKPVTPPEPLVLSLVQVDEGENAAPESGVYENAELKIDPLEEASLAEVAPQITSVPPSQQLDEKSETVAAIDTPAVKPDSTERTGSSPAHFTHQAAKQALNELLHNSQQAANRSRKRLLRMYGLLVVIATGLVGVYYYLLHQDATAALALPQPVLQQAVSTDTQTADAQAVTAPAEEAAAADVSETVDSAANSAVVPAQPASISPQLVPVHTQTTAQAGLTAEPVLTDTSTALNEPAPVSPADAASNQFNGEVLVPVDVPIRGGGDVPSQADAPIRIPATTVLAYQPAAQDDVSSAVEQGYAAYEAGDFATAAQAYRAALLLDPYQRDALLGAASVALQQGRPNDALSFYQQRLARAPKDDFALAGLLALSAQVASNPLLDAELNRLIITYPQAAHLHYLQGTLYAQRQQWGAAQLALLTAWQLDNHNPDIACNLAIAFDHLQQPEEAARFYRQALSLANGQAVSFALPAIRTRLVQLEGASVKERPRK